MGRIPVESSTVGSILDEDVTDSTGRVLLKAGTMILERHMKIFKTWGIKMISVRTNEQPTEIILSDEALEKGAEYAQILLRRNEVSHELIRTLQKLIQKRYATKIAEEERCI